MNALMERVSRMTFQARGLSCSRAAVQPCEHGPLPRAAYAHDTYRPGALPRPQEEDINVLTMGLPFEPPAGAAGERVAAALEGAMAAAGDLAAAAAGGDAALAGELAAALRCRLALRGALHGALRDAVSTDPQVGGGVLRGRGNGDATANHPLSRTGSVALSQRRLPSAPNRRCAACCPAQAVRGAVRRLAEARQLLALVRQSAGLGAPHLEAAPSFHPDANRHLLGPAPPRQVQVRRGPMADLL